MRLRVRTRGSASNRWRAYRSASPMRGLMEVHGMGVFYTVRRTATQMCEECPEVTRACVHGERQPTRCPAAVAS